MFQWSVVALNSAAEDTNAVTLLANTSSLATQAVVPLAASDLAPLAQLRFSLTVTSFLGGAATAHVDVGVAAQALPAVAIDGSTTRTVRADATTTTVIVKGAVNDCNGTVPLSPLAYSWSLLSVVRNPDTTADDYAVSTPSPADVAGYSHDDATKLKLPRLQVGAVYVFQATVTALSSPPVSNTATVTVTVVSAGITATIAGSDRTVGFDASWQLDASRSVDLDGVVDDPFVFAWDCAMIDGSSCTTAASAVFSPADGFAASCSDAVLAVANGTLPMGVYVFTVAVSKGVQGGLIPYHYRSDTASVTVTIVPGQPPEIDMAAAAVKVNPTQPRVSLVASVVANGRSDLALQWSCAELSGTDLAAVRLSPTLTSSTLVIKPALAPGVYTFSLTASDADSSVQASMAVTVNAPPHNGYVRVTPTTGYAIQTMFTMSALEWVADVDVRTVPCCAWLCV